MDPHVYKTSPLSRYSTPEPLTHLKYSHTSLNRNKYPLLDYAFSMSERGSRRSPLVNSRRIQADKTDARLVTLKHRLLIWKAICMGFSFLGLIILMYKLNLVGREIAFLTFITTDWLPKEVTTIRPLSRVPVLTHDPRIDRFREDVEALMVQLWSSRTTLLLSIAFIIVYIISWALLTYAAGHQNSKLSLEKKPGSMKTVLLLAIFATIDIAASGGFVLVRLVMYTLRDNHFFKEMRTPSSITEPDQMSAMAALRYSTLQSGAGSTDILVSIIIAFLSGLRIYCILCAVVYFNERRKKAEKTEDIITTNIPHIESTRYREMSTRTNPSFIRRKSHESSDRRSCTLTDSSTIEDDGGEFQIKIEAAEMPAEMQRVATTVASEACKLHKTEKHIAEAVKKHFDKSYGPSWHCIVGRNWGSCVTHSKQCYIRLLYKNLTLLLYKAS